MKWPGLAVTYAACGILAACTAAHADAPATQAAPEPPVGPVQPLSVAPDVKQVLQQLRDRKDTLKDFTGKIDYSVDDKGSATGKRGTVEFIMDPVKGPMFSADFDTKTVDGKPKLKYHVQFIFDGRDLTVKDFGTKNDVKQFIHSSLLPEGAKPGSAASLNGALPLPIGVEVNDVIKNFDVTTVPTKPDDANTASLKLVPREKGKFDYSQLEVTVDKNDKVQLPTKLVITANETVTTILITDIQINTGKAKMLDSTTPASEGWTQRGGSAKP